MAVQHLFMDYGGLIADYQFNQQTLERAHTLASAEFKISIGDLRKAHNKEIKAYLDHRKKTLEEWSLEYIMGEYYAHLTGKIYL